MGEWTDYEAISFIIGLTVSWLGAFFISGICFRKVWKSNVTFLKLAGFLVVFTVSFFLIIYGVLWLIDYTRPNVGFSR